MTITGLFTDPWSCAEGMRVLMCLSSGSFQNDSTCTDIFSHPDFVVVSIFKRLAEFGF